MEWVGGEVRAHMILATASRARAAEAGVSGMTVVVPRTVIERVSRCDWSGARFTVRVG